MEGIKAAIRSYFWERFLKSPADGVCMQISGDIAQQQGVPFPGPLTGSHKLQFTGNCPTAILYYTNTDYLYQQTVSFRGSVSNSSIYSLIRSLAFISKLTLMYLLLSIDPDFNDDSFINILYYSFSD